MSETKTKKYLSACIVWMFVLSAFGSMGGIMTNDATSEGLIVIDGLDDGISDDTTQADMVISPKIDSTLGGFIKEGTKGMTKVIVATTNTAQLAITLSKYEYRGLIGTKDTGNNFLKTHVLDVPVNSLEDIAGLSGVYGVYAYPDISQGMTNPEEKNLMFSDDAGNSPSSIYDAEQHNAQEAWIAGYIGTGSNVAIPEGGIDFGHPDLQGTQARVPATLRAIGETILEAVGGETEISLSSGDIIPGTYTIYVNGSALIPDTDYTIDLDSGDITFTPALEFADVITADYQFDSPYAGWPIVFDYNSMTTYLETSSTTDTWYVSTNETAIAYSTANTPELDIEVTVSSELTFSSDTAEVKTSTKLDHGAVKVGSIAVYADGTQMLPTEYSVNYDLGEVYFSPSILVSNIGVSYIYYTWDNVPDSQRIILKESTGYNIKSATGAESYTIDGLEPNTNYLFNIIATDEANNHGGFSNNPNAITYEDVTVPGQITDLMAVGGSEHGTIDLSWTAVGDDGSTGTATSYIIKYSEDPISNWVCFDYLSDEYAQSWVPAGTTITENKVITGLDIGVEYYFAIIAVDEAGNMGEVSNTDNAIVMDDIIAPARIDPTAYPGANSTQVYLQWTATGNNGAAGIASGYELRYSTSPITTNVEFQAATLYADSPNWIPMIAGNIENYTLEMPLGGTTYYFSIVAIDTAGNTGDISAPAGMAISAAADVTAPATINDLTVQTGPDHGTVYLNFTAPGDNGVVGWAEDYIIKSSTSPIDAANWGSASTFPVEFPVGNRLYPLPAEGGTSVSIILGLTDGVGWSYFTGGNDYYFAIQADDGANNGSVSNCDNAIAQNDIIGPSAITDLTASDSDNHGEILLEWTAPGDDGMIGFVKNYEIRYDTTEINDNATWDDADAYPIAQNTFESAFGFIPEGGDHVYLNFSGAGLDEGVKYFFAIKAKDEMSDNEPGISNSANGTARVDDEAPGTITLSAVATSQEGTVDLSWVAPGDDGNTGKVSKYEIRYVKAHYQNEFVDADIEYSGTLNPTIVKTTYTVTGINSESGVYRLGTLMDENLATYVNNYSGQIFNYSKLLLVDSVTEGVYDTVYVDLDYDQDFTDEKACVMGDEISWRDMDGNGLADRSGGMVYYISQANIVTDEIITPDANGTMCTLDHDMVVNNSWSVSVNGLLAESDSYVMDYEKGIITFLVDQSANTVEISYEYDGLPLPYSERLAERSGVDNVIPLNGELVAMYGEYTLDLTAGTSRASAVAGQGMLNHRNDINVKPCLGIAPDAKIIGITDPMYDGMIFAIEGYDGIPGTGDEANIYSSSLATSTYEAGGDFTSRYVDWLATEYGNGKTIFTATSGDLGSGYGTVTSPGSAPGVITAGLATDFFYRIVEEQDTGPYPSFGDIITVSGRGPTMMGNPKPDVVASGAYFGFVSEPLWAEYDRGPNAGFTDTVNIWSGQALTSSNLAASIAVISDAYDNTHSEPLDIETARSILMSGAEDINYDVLSQGAGFVDVMESVKIASDTGGSLITPSSWVPGDYDGERYEAFAKVVGADTLPENLEQTFTIENHDQFNSMDVDLAAGEMLKAGESMITITRDIDYGHGWTILNETGFYAPDGELLNTFDPALWTDTNMIKITQYSISDEQNYWIELFDWTDENGDGMLTGDLNGGPYDDPDLRFTERNRMSGAFIYGNVLEARLHSQAERTHDGIAIWTRALTAPSVELDIHIKAEFYTREAWDWVSLSDSTLTIPAGDSGTFTATLDSTKAMAEGVGSYEGAITSLSDVGKTTLIPMVVNVAADNPNFEFGGKPALDAVDNFVGVDFTTVEIVNFTMANETHLSITNATFNQTEFSLNNGGLLNFSTLALNNTVLDFSYAHQTNLNNPTNNDTIVSYHPVDYTAGIDTFYTSHQNIVPGTELFLYYDTYYEEWSWLNATQNNTLYTFDPVTGEFVLDWAMDLGDQLYAWYDYNLTGYITITNTSWYDVNYDTGLVTFNTSVQPFENGLKEDTTMHAWYDYQVTFVNETKRNEFILSNSNVLPESLVVTEDGKALSKFNTVSKEIIMNNSREYKDQEIIVATDTVTTTAYLELYEAGYQIGPGTYSLYLDGVLMVEGIDYDLDLQTGEITFSIPLDLGMVVTANYGTYAVGVTEIEIPNSNIYDNVKSGTDVLGYQIYRNGNKLTDGLHYFLSKIPVKNELSITSAGGEAGFNLVNIGIFETSDNTLYLDNAGTLTEMVESASAGQPNYEMNYNTGEITLNGWTLTAGESVHSFYNYSGCIDGKIKLNVFNQVAGEVSVESATAGQDTFSVFYNNLNDIGGSSPNTFYYTNGTGTFKLVKLDVNGDLNYKIDTATGDISLNGWSMAAGDTVVAYYNYTGLKSGDFFEIDYSYGRYLFNPINGELNFLSTPADGSDLEVTYSYYDCARLFDPSMIGAGFDGAGGRAGDWRYYYVDIPDQGIFTDPNTKLLLNVEWWKDLTDIDAFAFGETTLINPESGDTFSGERYGPHGLQMNGGSTETATFFTASGGPIEYSTPDIGSGLNVIAIHNVLMDGESNLEPVKGKVGTFSLDKDKVSIVTNELAGSASVTGVSNMDLGGRIGGVAAGPSAPVSYQDMEVWQDEADWSLFDTFDGQLASGNTTISVTLEDCLIFDVHIFGHTQAYGREGSFGDVEDLDLGVFLDENGDGITQEEELYAMDADGDADEQVKLIGPPDGTYLIRIYGFTLKSLPAHFDIDITNVQGLGFEVEGEGTDLTPDDPDKWRTDTPLPAYTPSTLDLEFDLPSAKDGITLQGALYIGPGEAPFTMLLPIELRYDATPPTSSGFSPGNGEMMRDTNPIITSNFKDYDFGELVPNSINMKVDGIDITPQATVSVPFVDDLDSVAPSPVQGYPLGTISYTPAGDMDEGIHYVESSCMDKAGNTYTDMWTFLIDTGLPSLIVNTPELDMAYTANEEYEITGLIEKNSTLNIYGVEIVSLIQNDGKFSANILLENGENAITITATDLSGNKMEIKKSIVLDQNMPSFEGFVCEEGSRTNKDKVSITGAVDETGYLTINGKDVVVNSVGSFSTVVNLIKGENVLHLSFTDMAGNTVDDWMNVTLDQTLPQIIMDDLPTKVYSKNFTFGAQIDEEELKIGGVRVNGKQVTVESTRGISEFQRTVILSYGINTIVIEVEDRAGNVVEFRHAVEFTVDTTTTDGNATDSPDVTSDGTTKISGMFIAGLLIVGLVIGMFVALLISRFVPDSGTDEEQIDEPDEDEGPLPEDGMDADQIPEGDEIPDELEVDEAPLTEDELPEDMPDSEDEMSSEEIADSIIDDEIPEDLEASEDISSEMEMEDVEAEPDVTEEPELDIPEEEATEMEVPEENEQVLRLKQAFEDGKISEELYEKNLAKLKE